MLKDFLHNEYKPEDEKLFKMLVELRKGGEGDCVDPITVSKYVETEYRKRVLAKVVEMVESNWDLKTPDDKKWINKDLLISLLQWD